MRKSLVTVRINSLSMGFFSAGTSEGATSLALCVAHLPPPGGLSAAHNKQHRVYGYRGLARILGASDNGTLARFVWGLRMRRNGVVRGAAALFVGPTSRI